MGVPPVSGDPGCGTVRCIFHKIGLCRLVSRPVDPGRSVNHRATRHRVSGRIKESRQTGLFTNPVEHNSEKL